MVKVYYIIKIDNGDNSGYMLNSRCLVNSREIANKYYSKSYAGKAVMNSIFNRCPYEILPQYDDEGKD
ncbi:MAG: hypothetical protein LIO69_04550 [Oscillospiraceae bacterium]|nr:hypothetical protein [Oscillospiraceae bacterium]